MEKCSYKKPGSLLGGLGGNMRHYSCLDEKKACSELLVEQKSTHVRLPCELD